MKEQERIEEALKESEDFEVACRQARQWRERYPNRENLMCVNLSVSQFAYQADLIPKLLSDTGLDPEALRLEITERAVMDDAEFAIGKLQRLKTLGMSFAIDDYGTGYSCLYYLKRMPVDSLKIDGSFVAGLGKDPGDDAIVSGTIDLAHALGLNVVAEGVETAEQSTKLQELRPGPGLLHRQTALGRRSIRAPARRRSSLALRRS